MIDNGKIDDLARMYKLFCMVETGLPTLRKALKGSIGRRGKEINDLTRGTEDDQAGEEDIDHTATKGKEKGSGKASGYTAVAFALKWVEDILALKDIFDRVLKHSFSDDMTVQVSMVEVH